VYAHHIALIGGEVAPITIGYLSSPASVIHIVYSPETQSKAKSLRRFFQNRGCRDVRFVPTDAFSPASIYATADTLFRSLADTKCILNYTGGTKQMSIGFFSAAIKHQADCMYTDSQNVNITFLSKGAWSVQPYPKVDISIREWLQLHDVGSFEMAEAVKYKPYEDLIDWIFKSGNMNLKPIRDISDYAQQILDNTKKYKPLQHWQIAFNQDQLVVTPINNGQGLTVSFKETTFSETDRNWWVPFFAFNWFEFWIFKTLKDTGAYNDICLNLQVFKPGANNARMSYNEIDVVAIKDGYIHLIDAKLGWVDMKSLTKMRTNRQMYATKYSRMIMVTWFHANKVSDTRAKELNIEIISGPDRIADELPHHHLKYHKNSSL
jgi:hypothetical protein